MTTATDSPIQLLVRIAPQLAAAWHTIGARSFRGEASVETSNSVYRFRNGVFVSRATRPSRSFDAPSSMRGLRLVGFLREVGGRWALSPRWTPGAHAVLWRASRAGEVVDARAFLVTSPAIGFAIEEPEPAREPEPQPWAARAPSPSGVHRRRAARPPSIVRPEPPSMTRVHAADLVPSML